jgi:hypothetical protein
MRIHSYSRERLSPMPGLRKPSVPRNPSVSGLCLFSGSFCEIELVGVWFSIVGQKKRSQCLMLEIDVWAIRYQGR